MTQIPWSHTFPLELQSFFYKNVITGVQTGMFLTLSLFFTNFYPSLPMNDEFKMFLGIRSKFSHNNFQGSYKKKRVYPLPRPGTSTPSFFCTRIFISNLAYIILVGVWDMAPWHPCPTHTPYTLNFSKYNLF